MTDNKNKLFGKINDGWKQSENLWKQLIDLHKSSARFLEKMLTMVDDLIEKLEAQQSTIRFSKGLSAVGTATGTALMFTPLFFVGAGVAAASAITGVGTSVYDTVVTGQAQEQTERYRELATEYLQQFEERLFEFKKFLEAMDITLKAGAKLFTKNEYIATARGVTATLGTLTAGAAALSNSVSASAIGNVIGTVHVQFSENKSLQNARLLVSGIRDNIKVMEKRTEDMNEAMNKLKLERTNLENELQTI